MLGAFTSRIALIFRGSKYNTLMASNQKSKKIWLVLLGSIVVLFVSAWLAKRGRLVLGEEHMLVFIYGLPESLRLFFLTVTFLGSAWILAVVLIALLMKERFDIALRVMTAGIGAYIVVGFAKEFVGRPRPGELADLLQRELLVFGYGFPSGHTALATAIAFVLAAYLPKERRFIVPVWIGLVATSRLYLGVHAPLDIVGGFCIGILLAVCVLIILPPGRNISGIRLAKKQT
jgi:undecaprenyl-diphosphatase